MTAGSAPGALIAELNEQYDARHRAFEDNFWATKMALQGCSTEALTRTKLDLDAFLSDAGHLKAVEAAISGGAATPGELKVLEIMRKTFETYVVDDARVAELKAQLTAIESELDAKRGSMRLGFEDPEKGFVECSSVRLRTEMRTNPDERIRKAAYEGLQGIGTFVVEDLCRMVKLRNEVARLSGFVDYYDMSVTQAEGFGKQKLFEMMDDLRGRTDGTMHKAREYLAKKSPLGEDALKPWNTGFSLAGETDRKMDPYFPFEDAVAVWGRSFAALRIGYRGATMNLDLLDRKGKYSNGFCHWPVCAYNRVDAEKGDKTWVPSVANFTSLASPTVVGSGNTALTTLLHEGGHAAHFANVVQDSPLFAQERPPFSVALAETQSMFLDSLADDAAWLGRYAKDREGRPVPWDLVEESIRAKHPYAVFDVRAMIAVPYFEKALYELPDAEVTPANVLALAERMEVEVQGGPAGRPLMSVPHILSDEASCYYHGYVLAEMAVRQTRAHFLAQGQIVDNPSIGPALAESYWRAGNSEPFLDLVVNLTGKPLSSDAWADALAVPLEDKVRAEKADYDAAVKTGPYAGPLDVLDMRVRLVHGDETISDSEVDGGFDAACAKFKEWVKAGKYNA